MDSSDGWLNDAVFAAAVKIVFEHEGGFQKNPDDSGNWTGAQVGRGELRGTNWGISAASHPELPIEQLSQDQAAAIYYSDWWQRYGYRRLPTAIATKLLDLAVPAPRAAHQALQRALRDLGCIVTEDGDLGPITAACVATANKPALLARFQIEWTKYCLDIAARYRRLHHAPDPFLEGWVARACA